MTSAQVIPIVISLAALLLSMFTAYRTFLARFKGDIYFSNRIVLGHVDNVPSLGLACFIENSGAKPGILDDLRAKIVPKDSGTTYYFYPILMRNDYSIYKAYTEQDWYPFSMVSLPPNYRIEKYLLLKPQNDKFVSTFGDLDISLEVRWHNQENWKPIGPVLSYTLGKEIVDRWNDCNSSAIQINSNEIMSKRRL